VGGLVARFGNLLILITATVHDVVATTRPSFRQRQARRVRS
jgi:hypothetical protein